MDAATLIAQAHDLLAGADNPDFESLVITLGACFLAAHRLIMRRDGAAQAE